MSHDYGKVYTKENNEWVLFGHFEYNGTVDCVCTAIQLTQLDVNKYWRSPENMRYCDCKEKNWEEVKLHSDYGRGFDWFGKICRRCMAITDGLMPFEPTIENRAFNGMWDYPISPITYFELEGE